MPVAVPYYVPIRAPRGRLVHAASDTTAGRTVCGMEHSHWRIAVVPREGSSLVSFAARFTCRRCRRVLGLPPHTRRQRRP